MRTVLIAQDQAGFDAWLTRVSDIFAGRTYEQVGELLYTSKGCVACHSTDGSKRVGPSFMDVYGHEVELRDGGLVTADDAYIRQSILEPNTMVVAGYEPVMTPYAGQISDREIEAVTAWLKTMSSHGGGSERGRVRHHGCRRRHPAEGERMSGGTGAPNAGYLGGTAGPGAWLGTRDHKRIAVLFLGWSLGVFVLGLLYAIIMKLRAQSGIIDTHAYHQMLTQHGILMVFLYVVPAIPSILGHFVLPLQLGTTQHGHARASPCGASASTPWAPCSSWSRCSPVRWPPAGPS